MKILDRNGCSLLPSDYVLTRNITRILSTNLRIAVNLNTPNIVVCIETGKGEQAAIIKLLESIPRKILIKRKNPFELKPVNSILKKVDEPKEKIIELKKLPLVNTFIWNRGKPLVNLGNSCYINSILNAILSLKYVSEIFIQSFQKQPLRALIKQIATSADPSTRDLCCWLAKNSTKFIAERQNDAHEFLAFLIDQLGKESKEELFDGFEFSIEVELDCSKCKRKKNFVEKLSDLPLPISALEPDSHSSISQVLELYFKEEKVLMNCEDCESNEFIMKRKIKKFPTVLILHLKRFIYDSDSFVKIERQISMEMIVELFGHRFELKSVVSHLGSSIDSGHYICDIFHDSMHYRVDDDKISTIAETDDLPTKNSYILFLHSIQ